MIKDAINCVTCGMIIDREVLPKRASYRGKCLACYVEHYKQTTVAYRDTNSQNAKLYRDRNLERLAEKRRERNRLLSESENPEVILKRQVANRVKKQRVKARKIDAIKQDGKDIQRCANIFCRTPILGRFEIDHIIPISKGGPDHPENLQILCVTCNRRKHNLLPKEWLAAEVWRAMRIAEGKDATACRYRNPT